MTSVKQILRNLPIVDQPAKLRVGKITITLPRFRILVWVTLCEKGKVDYDENAPLIPAVLDTGFNHNFSIREEQLQSWLNLDPQDLRFVGKMARQHERGEFDVVAQNIWLHGNKPNKLPPNRQDPTPTHMELNKGIMVFRGPEEQQNQQTPKDTRPKLPLLGMQALRRNNMILTIDFKHDLVNLNKVS